jgi:nucleoside-diphosphate-sugar epimerase
MINICNTSQKLGGQVNIKILVTGGSGFIGTNVVQFYLDKNIEVLSLDIARPRNSAHACCFTQLDICNKKLLVDCMCKYRPTHVIHLAARTDLNGAKLSDYPANIIGVENVIEAINQSGKVKKALFASSMLVCEVGYQPVDYDDYRPSTVYGESKVLTEIIIKNHTSIHSEWNIIRPTSIWGPWFGQPYRNFFDILIRGRYVNLKAFSATKTFGFVGNSVYQLDELLFSQDSALNHKTLYIGDSPPINISEWADEILLALEKSPAIKLPYPLFKMLALFGDWAGKLGVNIPMNSFRLRNMTTNNICQLDDLYDTVGVPPYSRAEGIRQTLNWMRK